MATFRKRGNKWSYRIDLGTNPVTGKREQPTISKSKEFPKGFFTKKDAISAATKHQAELDAGTHVEEKDITFERLYDMWIADYSLKVKLPTVRLRKIEAKHFLKRWKHIMAKVITKKMYQDAINEMKSVDELADSTIQGIHVTGNMIFEFGVRFDLIKHNPAEAADLPKTQVTVEQLESETPLPKYLEKEELALFLETARQHGKEDDYFIFTLLAYSGMRVGELCVLKWSDFNAENQTVSITKTYYNPQNNMRMYSLVTPKTKSSRRTIELEPLIFELLDKQRLELEQVKHDHSKTYYNKGYVFVNRNEFLGYPRYIKLIENHMTRLLKLAGLNASLTPHSLRHTHTSLLAEAGVSIEAIMERLGHKDDETTKNIYLHVTKSVKKEASKKFGSLMKNVLFTSEEVEMRSNSPLTH